MSASTLQVDRKALLDGLKAAKAEVIAEHKAAKAAYPGELAAWNSLVKVELVSLARRVNGKLVKGLDSTYGGKLEVPVRVPNRPSDPGRIANTCKLDRYIKLVSLTQADTFRLRTDDDMLSVLVPNRC